MAVGIDAAGILGVAHEDVKGTYLAPEIFVPLISESLDVVQSNIYRRPIRGITDILAAVPGPTHVEGNITVEVFHESLPYFMYAMNMTVVKSGTGDLTYTGTPAHAAEPAETLSITVDRNGEGFGYVACAVSSLQLTVQNGILVASMQIIGESEATQTSPTAVWPTSVPLGVPGDYKIEIPTASQVFDADSFTIDINDNLTPEFRLEDADRAPRFLKYGEREVKVSMERDFETRTEYDAFKLATAQAITIIAEQSATRLLQFDMESAIHDSYAVNLGSQGDLTRAQVEYQGVYNVTDSRSYLLVVKTDEIITI